MLDGRDAVLLTSDWRPARLEALFTGAAVDKLSDVLLLNERPAGSQYFDVYSRDGKEGQCDKTGAIFHTKGSKFMYAKCNNLVTLAAGGKESSSTS